MEEGGRYLKEVADATHIISPSEQWKLAVWNPSVLDAAMMRVPGCLIFFLFLWAIDVWVMDMIQLSYHHVLGLKPSTNSPLCFVLATALFYAALYAFHMTWTCGFFEMDVEYAVFIFYSFVLMSFAPFFPGHESRMYIFRVLKHIIVPSNTISFPEIMVADALCSLSKIFKDFGITLVVLYADLYSGVNGIDFHNQAMVLFAFLSSIPFGYTSYSFSDVVFYSICRIRIRQCNIQLQGAEDFKAKIPITLNIIKYFTSLPPIWLAAVASLGYYNPNLSSITALMATLNSGYCYLWDIIMDWVRLCMIFSHRLILPQPCRDCLPFIPINHTVEPRSYPYILLCPHFRFLFMHS